MGSEHTAKAFDDDLQELNRLVAEMGGLAERQIVDSVDALIRREIGAFDGALRVRQVEGGQSNPTFIVDAGARIPRAARAGRQRGQQPRGRCGRARSSDR